MNKKAFTIVELIVVIVIIGVLAAILIPNLVRYIDKAHVTKDMELVRNLNTALSVDTKEHKIMTEALEAAENLLINLKLINMLHVLVLKVMNHLKLQWLPPKLVKRFTY